MWCLSLAGKGAMVTELIRTEQVFSAAAMCRQINLEDRPTSGLEIEMSKFIFWRRGKRTHAHTHTPTYIHTHRLVLRPNICSLMHDCLLPLRWQGYSGGLHKAVKVSDDMYGYFNIKVTKILLGCTSPGSRQFTAKSWSGAPNVQPQFLCNDSDGGRMKYIFLSFTAKQVCHFTWVIGTRKSCSLFTCARNIPMNPLSCLLKLLFLFTVCTFREQKP